MVRAGLNLSYESTEVCNRTGSGFTLHIDGLSSLSLQLGTNTTTPSVAVGLSVNYGEFTTLQLTNGTNSIPLPSGSKSHSSVIRLNVEVSYLSICTTSTYLIKQTSRDGKTITSILKRLFSIRMRSSSHTFLHHSTSNSLVTLSVP